MKEAVWPWFAVIPAVMGSQESGPIHVFTSSPWQLPGEPAVGSLLGSDCVPVKRDVAVLTPGPQNVTSFGNGAIADVTS